PQSGVFNKGISAPVSSCTPEDLTCPQDSSLVTIGARNLVGSATNPSATAGYPLVGIGVIRPLTATVNPSYAITQPNRHPMKTRSKSGVVKKKVFHVKISDEKIRNLLDIP
ncbi:hypothetical protein U1Q18_003909, partial [Sarracenia purpurea var. burkii]